LPADGVLASDGRPATRLLEVEPHVVDLAVAVEAEDDRLGDVGAA
jgi:hypothetical protein